MQARMRLVRFSSSRSTLIGDVPRPVSALSAGSIRAPYAIVSGLYLDRRRHTGAHSDRSDRRRVDAQVNGDGKSGETEIGTGAEKGTVASR